MDSEMTEELRKSLLDFGALSYSVEQMGLVLGMSRVEVADMLQGGGQVVYDQGRARFRFALDRKIMELAMKGDLKAIEKLESRQNKSFGAKIANIDMGEFDL